MVTEAEDNVMDVSAIKTEDFSELTYEEKVAHCNVIAKPMASKKLAKKCFKLIKKGIVKPSKYFNSLFIYYFSY